MTSDCTIVTTEQYLYQTIVQFDKTIVLPRKLATGNIHYYLFCNCPLVGILFEILRIALFSKWIPAIWFPYPEFGIHIMSWLLHTLFLLLQFSVHQMSEFEILRIALFSKWSPAIWFQYPEFGIHIMSWLLHTLFLLLQFSVHQMSELRQNLVFSLCPLFMVKFSKGSFLISTINLVLFTQTYSLHATMSETNES